MRATCGEEFEAALGEKAGDGDNGFFVGISHGKEDSAFCGEDGTGGDLAFGEGHFERGVDAHDFAGRAHLGAEDHVDTGKFGEGEN